MGSTSRIQLTNLVLSDKVFRKTYYNDSCGFVKDCFDWKDGQGPTDYQEEMLAESDKYDWYSCRGPRGFGKTAFASWKIWHFALTRDGNALGDWKAITTAGVWRQLVHFLWPEIHKWGRLIKWWKIGREPLKDRIELLDTSIKLTTGEAFAVASDRPDLVEGAHAEKLLYLFDEAKAVPVPIWDSVEGSFSGMGKDTKMEGKFLAIGTPGETQGRLYQIHQHSAGFEKWHTRHVKIDEVIKAGRISSDWVEDKRKVWGETSILFKNQVLGEFASNVADGIIPLSWVEAANERWLAWNEQGRPGKLTMAGVDVGGGQPGADASVIAPVMDWVKVYEIRMVAIGDPNLATMELVGHVHGLLDKHRTGTAIIDMIGIGLGVLQRLRELGDRVAGFGAAARTELREKTGELGFLNWRAAMWWVGRELLDPSGPANICLPPDDRLTGELTAPRYKVVSNGLIQVEAKEQVIKRIGRSTDCADAVLMGLVGPALLNELARNNQEPEYTYDPVRIG